MTNTSHETIYLKDYVAPKFVIKAINLDIDLYEDYAIVTSILHCEHNKKGSPVRLDGYKLTLKSIKLNEQNLLEDAYSVDDNGLTIHTVPEIFTLEIITYIQPHLNTELVGLYKTKNIFCTQCEAEGFRRITYYLDRPDVMTKFTTTIRGDKQRYPVLLSNGNLIAKKDLPNGRHAAIWQDPFKKPSYLFALVAGDLVSVEDHFLTKSGRLIAIKIYVEAENIEKTAHALQALKTAMLWDEQKYGREYDLDIYMIVAINDFNMGAMENKGLNIFNSKYVLASPSTATDQDFSRIDAVIAHEYFHNWSGNRVTCRDWFQLSLKEGFTVFREQQFIEDITATSTVRIEQVKSLLTHQFVEDASKLAHSVRPSSYEEINNFYTATVYEKGAEIVRMLWVLLGEKTFLAATDVYFSRYDGQAITIEDFLKIMQESSGIDLSQFMLWYEQAGTPRVMIEHKFDALNQQYTLILQQHCPATPGQADKKPMHIPIAIGLLDQAGKPIALQTVDDNQVYADTKIISLTKEQQSFTFINVANKPVLSVLRNFSAPVIVEYESTMKELVLLIKYDTDPFNRWEACRRLKRHGILQLISMVNAKQELTLNPLLLESFRDILTDASLNHALKAELLLFPSNEEILECMEVADPDIVYKVKSFLKPELAETLALELHTLYDYFALPKRYIYSAADITRRQLKNVCLDYLVSLNDNEMLKLGLEQFNNADNMTDIMGVLNAIIHVDCGEKDWLLRDFYKKWQHDPLLMNKWLLLQASSELPRTINKVKLLLDHKVFDIHNPNKVYALVGGFGNNVIRFHAINGEGYQLLTKILLQLDKINPQVSAKMAKPFAKCTCYSLERQLLIQKSLTKIIETKGISKNLREIVTKCLQ